MAPKWMKNGTKVENALINVTKVDEKWYKVEDA
jgi:hypothetical protein